jgi:HK97 family phage major capsid protein
MAFNIKQLRQRKADLVAKATAVSEAANGRDLTDPERAEYDAAMASVKIVNGDIARAEALMDEERNTPASQAIEVSAPEAVKKPWASLGEQLTAVRKVALTNGRETDPRLFAALGANESVDAEGGFLVAPEFSDTILQRTYNEGQVTSRCSTIPMNSNRLVINGLDEDSRATGQRYGGIQVFRVAEAAAYTNSKPKFKQVTLTANKLIGLLYATDEILEDQSALSKWASDNFPKAFAFQLDDEAVNGTGAGQMLGVQNSGAAIVVAKDTGQASGTLSATNVFNMHQRLWGPSRKNAVWFLNSDLENQLWNLTRGSGTAVELLYNGPGKNGNDQAFGVMLGHPVVFIEQAAAGGTQGDINLFDMSQYLIGQKEGIKTDSSIHVQFLTGEQVFRWTLRNDGQPIPKKPLTPYKGSNTLSPFVTLAARP